MRVIGVLLYLMKNRKVTVEQLSIEFDVSKRTIQRDIDVLSTLGIPIISKQGKNGGILIDEKYVLSKSLLTRRDYDSIITSLYIGENISENIDSMSVLNKFIFLESSKLKDIYTEIDEYFVVDLMKEKVNLFKGMNKLINCALKNKNTIRFCVGSKTYKINPISYILKSDGVYLYFYSENQYLLIKIDKIEKIHILKETYNRDYIHYRDNKDIKILE